MPQRKKHDLTSLTGAPPLHGMAFSLEQERINRAFGRMSAGIEVDDKDLIEAGIADLKSRSSEDPSEAGIDDLNSSEDPSEEYRRLERQLRNEGDEPVNIALSENPSQVELSPDGLPIVPEKDIVVEPHADDEFARYINTRLQSLRDDPPGPLTPLDELIELDPRIPEKSTDRQETLPDVVNDSPGESGILLDGNTLDTRPYPFPPVNSYSRKLPTPPGMGRIPQVIPEDTCKGMGCFGRSRSRKQARFDDLRKRALSQSEAAGASNIDESRWNAARIAAQSRGRSNLEDYGSINPEDYRSINPALIVRKGELDKEYDEISMEMQELEKRAKEMGLDERVINKYKSDFVDAKEKRDKLEQNIENPENIRLKQKVDKYREKMTKGSTIENKIDRLKEHIVKVEGNLDIWGEDKLR